jgi:predicted flap endonuclease-1-like 5' DNA nuclease
MNFESINIWCWLIPLLVGVLCAIFGYLLGKGANTAIDHSSELNLLKDQNAKLEADLAACNKKMAAESSAVASSEIDFNKSAAKAAFGKNIKQDDLKVVEGIGPKIEGLFHNYDIKTWKALSKTSVSKCRQVLDSGGDRYKVHDPASWPLQAKMCYAGKWKALHKWQVEHKRGKL